jgi:3-hydroxy-9,10-secoandrosta-1,3,5(10)-triene-9,17-dione monooxygenase
MDTPPKLPAGKKSFADVTYDEAMRRAEALIPLLKAHADESEKLTHMAPAVVSALHESGLLRYMQPKRWGGMELDFVSVFDLPEMLGRGDASAAWTFTNLAAHHRLLALWDARAQEEIWGDDPDMLIASGIAFAQGRAVKTDGGYRITGRWGFSSGVDVSTWNMLACQVFDGDKIVDYRMCLVPLPDFEVIDDWQTLGMRGTGSRTVQCKDIFVPEHRALSMYTQRPGFEYPGWKVNTAAQYRIPLSGFGGTGIGGCMTGNARAMLDAAIDMVKARSTAYTGAKMRDFQNVQLRIGMAGAKIDAGRLLLRTDCIEVQRTLEAGGTVDIPTRLRYKRNSSAGIKLVVEAVDTLFEMAGANGIYDSAPMQRMFRDAHAGGAHINFNCDVNLSPWALVMLGGEFRSPTL